MNTISFLELKNKFALESDKTPNKKYLIENEIEEINSFLRYIRTPKAKFKLHKPIYRQVNNHIFQIEISHFDKLLFIEAFHSYLMTGEFELVKHFHDTEETYEHKKQIVNQAFEFKNYFLWLKELLIEPKQVKSNSSSIGLKEKLLALNYLGLDLSQYENNKASKVLSQILGHSEENVRKYLSYLNGGKNEVRTARTLENTLKLFKVKGFEEISSNIEADLEKTLQR